ncbi:CHC2 zinc finger domain-containing protein [Caminibacter pacificus]|jgi:DNA primase
MDLRERARKLKELYLNGVEVVKLMQFLGYEFDRRGFTSIRAERTPSVRVRKDGLIKDFGSGWSGDIFDLLTQYHQMSFKEAVEYVEKAIL